MNKFCFIHIEKAGGSTIHNWLKYYIPSYVSLNPWYYWSNEDGNYVTKKELKILKLLHPGIKGFGGHTTRHFLGYEDLFEGELHYFTFLRNPVSRYLSHFQFQKYHMNIDWTFEEFVDEERFNNYMSVRIAGESNGERAFKELRDKFSFVGLVEHFNESMLMLTSILDDKSLAPYYEIRNETNKGKRINYENLSENLKDKVLENNKEDLYLYEQVLQDIYPIQLKEFKRESRFSLKEYENQLQHFKYNKLRKELTRIFKGYNYYISEPISHLLR